MWLWIIAAGVAVRLALLLLVDPAQTLTGGDSAAYIAAAQNIWAGHSPGSHRAPLYPAFLALTLPLGCWFPMVVQSAMTIASGIMACRRGHFLAGLLIATCPFLAFYDFRLLSESLYINLVLWAWLARMPVASGVLLGFAILTRDTLLLLPAAALLALRTRNSAITAAIAYACVLPWVATSGPTGQSRAGLNLWVGTWERNGDWYANGLSRPNFPPYAFLSPEEERLIRSTWPNVPLSAAVDRIKGNPAGSAEAWAARYWRLWIGTRSDQIAFRVHGIGWTLAKSALWGLNLLTLLFGLWGLRAAKWAIPVLYVAAIYLPFHNVETRYSLLAVPFLLYLGARRLAVRHQLISPAA